MNTEYDSDDFDMEQVAGVDNPAELDDVHDENAGDMARPGTVINRPKGYTMRTRFKSVDKKTGQLVYKVVEQKSNENRKLLKPFSYKKKR